MVLQAALSPPIPPSVAAVAPPLALQWFRDPPFSQPQAPPHLPIDMARACLLQDRHVVHLAVHHVHGLWRLQPCGGWEALPLHMVGPPSRMHQAVAGVVVESAQRTKLQREVPIAAPWRVAQW